MATEQQLMQALRKADAAGDTAAAEQFAGMIKRMRDKPAPKPPSWGQVARDIPAAAGRNLADLALGVGPNIYNLAGMAVSAPLVAAGMDPSRAFQPIGQARVPDYTPENMTGLQSAVHKGGQFATEAAMLPAQATARLATQASPAAQGVVRSVVDRVGRAAGSDRSVNAALAGTGGAVGDVAGREYGAGAELAANLLTPLGVVGGLKGLGVAGNKLGDVAALIDVAGPNTGFGENRLMRGVVQRAAEQSPPESLGQIRQSLNSGSEYVAGARPTTAQALAQARAENPTSPNFGGGLITLERQLAGTDPYQSVINARTGIIADEIASLSGGATTAERQATRGQMAEDMKGATRPAFEAAEGLADKGARVLKRLEQWRTNKRAEIEGRQAGADAGRQQAGQVAETIPPLERTRNNATQQEGQLRTDAAWAEGQMRNRPALGPIEQRIADRDGSFGQVVGPEGQFPGQSAVPNPLQPNRSGFSPVPGQPRVPGRYSPLADYPKQANQAADEFAETAARARQDIAEANEQIDTLMGAVQRRELGVDQARSELAELASVNVRSLQGAPISQRLDSMNRSNWANPLSRRIVNTVKREVEGAIDPNTGTVPAGKLAALRSSMNESIERLLGPEASPASKKSAAKVAARVKSEIDLAFDQAGAGKEWQSALEAYSQHAAKLDKQKVLDLLARAATPVEGTGRINSKQFLAWTGDDQAKLLKKGKIDSDKSLEAILGPEDYQRVMNIRKDLLRDEVAQGTKTLAPSDFDDTPQAINVLDPKIAIFNWALRFMSEGNRSQIVNKLSDVMATRPDLVASMMQAQRQGIPFSDWARTVPGLLEYSDNRLSQTLEQ